MKYNDVFSSKPKTLEDLILKRNFLSLFHMLLVPRKVEISQLSSVDCILSQKYLNKLVMIFAKASLNKRPFTKVRKTSRFQAKQI